MFRDDMHHHGMACFMESDDAFFFLAHQSALALRPDDDALNGFLELILTDHFLVAAGR